MCACHSGSTVVYFERLPVISPPRCNNILERQWFKLTNKDDVAMLSGMDYKLAGPGVWYLMNGCCFIHSALSNTVSLYLTGIMAAIKNWLSLAPILLYMSTCVNALGIHRDLTSIRPSYDYIIAGGGLTGLVVANRLTEDGKSELSLRNRTLSINYSS